MVLLVCTLISSTKCSSDINKKKELLTGDWILVGDQWYPGFRLTQDSIFPLFEQSGSLSVRQNLGEPYKLTKDDSLIFGPPDYIENQWDLNKELRGFWKINKLTEDSLMVKDFRGTMNFYRKTK